MKEKIKQYKWWIIIGVVVIIVVLVFFYDNLRPNIVDTNSSAQSRMIDDTKDNKEFIDLGSSDEFLPQGSYKVGVDLDPGTYLISGASSVIIKNEDQLDTDESIVDRENLNEDVYVDVTDGEYLIVEGEEAQINKIE